MAQSDYFPPGAFNFSVSIDNANEGSVDAHFQEVSGITMQLEVETIYQNTTNDYRFKPKKTTYTDLVLKRGLVIANSSLSDWCQSSIQMKDSKVTPKTITINLLDPTGDTILMAWSFKNAFPIKWEISALDAEKNAIVTEKITFKFSSFEIKDV